jgi:hypothetical protein
MINYVIQARDLMGKGGVLSLGLIRSLRSDVNQVICRNLLVKGSVTVKLTAFERQASYSTQYVMGGLGALRRGTGLKLGLYTTSDERGLIFSK